MATVQANRHAAEIEAQHLVSLFQPPTGAVRLSRAPTVLAAGPVEGTPSTADLVDDVEYWQVPIPDAALGSWLRSHQPVGLTSVGSSSSNSGVAGTAYNAGANPDWQSAQLEIGIGALTASTTAVRVDGLVAWTDPRPMPDDVPGRRVNVTVAGGCPSNDLNLVGVTNPGADLTSSLLPAGQPTAALVCFYNGLNGAADKLVHQARLGAAPARRLAAAARALPLTRSDLNFGHCPADDGSVAIVAFSYTAPAGSYTAGAGSNTAGAGSDLWVNLTGCGGVANGYIDVASGNFAQVIDQYR